MLIPIQCETFEHLQVTVAILPSERVTCAFIYRPPHTSAHKFLSKLSDYCLAITQAKTNTELCCLGDFNIKLKSNINNVK